MTSKSDERIRGNYAPTESVEDKYHRTLKELRDENLKLRTRVKELENQVDMFTDGGHN